MMNNFKRIFSIILLALSLASANTPCQAMNQEAKEENTSLELEDIPQDCFFVVFNFLPFNELLHKTSMVSKKWRGLVYKLFGTRGRGHVFIINIDCPIKHPKYLYELSQFAQFLEKSMAVPYLFNCPCLSSHSKIEIEKTAINSNVEHTEILRKVHNRLRFNFGYAKEYSTKWWPCYLYSILKHLRKLNPPRRIDLFSNYGFFNNRERLISNARKGKCTCGKYHFPNFTSEHKTMEMKQYEPKKEKFYSTTLPTNTIYSYKIGNQRTNVVAYSVGYIDVDSEERKRELIEEIMQILQNESDFYDQDISEIHKEIAKNKNKLTAHYRSIGRKLNDLMSCLPDGVLVVALIAWPLPIYLILKAFFG